LTNVSLFLPWLGVYEIPAHDFHQVVDAGRILRESHTASATIRSASAVLNSNSAVVMPQETQ
jgi:hypothetical protein